MSLLLVLLVLLTAQALQSFSTNDKMAGVNRMFCEQIWLDLANVFPGSGVVLSFRDGMRNDGSTTLAVPYLMPVWSRLRGCIAWLVVDRFDLAS